MPKIALFTRVRFDNYLLRYSEWEEGRGTVKRWKPNRFGKPGNEGYVIGYRTLSNGVARYYGDHIEYNTYEHIKVALVLPTRIDGKDVDPMRRNSVYVELERLVVIETEGDQ